MKPTDQEIKEFWEKCGLSKRGGYWWYDMQGNHLTANSPPPIDLNTLFKLAVPLVHNIEIIKLRRFEGEWQTAYRVRVRLARQRWQSPVQEKELEDALFRAIQQGFKEK